jgi:hypothetical protein
MRKKNLLKIRHSSVKGEVSNAPVGDDGIMAIPIPDEMRDAADSDMKAFIKIHRKKQGYHDK